MSPKVLPGFTWAMPFGLGAGRARHIHAAGVAEPAVQRNGDIYIDDVAIRQSFITGDAVADDMVDGCADGFGKATVIQRRGRGAMGENEVMADLVEMVGGNARGDMRADHVQRLGGQEAGRTHGDEILRPVNCYPPSLGAAIHHRIMPITEF
jgi:hypothetical protein